MTEDAENVNLEGVGDEDTGLSKSRIVWFAVIVVGAAATASAGYLAGKVLASAGPDSAEADELNEEPVDVGDFRYYSFEPITVTLKTPRGDRYLRTAIALKIPAKYMDAASEILEKRNLDIKDWLIVYLSNHTLEEVLGGKNQNRIRREILDSLNEMLWPSRKPRIRQVLMKEFAVQ